MPMTLTEKVLARAAGKSSVQPGEFLEIEPDLGLANDITAPLAIDEFERTGAKAVRYPERVFLVADHFTPNKDIQSAEQVKQLREFAGRHPGTRFFAQGEVGIEHALLPEMGAIVPGHDRDRRRLAHVHLRRPGGLRHRRRFYGPRRLLPHGPGLVEGALDHQGRLLGKARRMGDRQGSHPRPDRPYLGFGRHLPGPRVHRTGHRRSLRRGQTDHGKHGDRGRRQERHLRCGREDRGVPRGPNGSEVGADGRRRGCALRAGGRDRSSGAWARWWRSPTCPGT